MLIYRQTQRSPYSSVSVLLLRWEEDASVEKDLADLEAVLRERYNYHTDRWSIPTVPNPSIKLGVQMASFLENARADHLLIIYYAGHGYIGTDNHLYWACHKGDDASKLKWDGVRCLFEDAQSDMLLLLDSCAPREAPMAGSHGVKQAIAAYTTDQIPRETPARSFTSCLAESLSKLSAGRPFTTQRLQEEVALLQQKSVPERALTNGAAGPPTPQQDVCPPVLFTLTAGKGQGISLPVLPPPGGSRGQAEQPNGDNNDARIKQEDELIGPEAVADLTFDEARALVCTTFVGDASQDMTFFNSWLQNATPIGIKLTVEGMFLGPPTMLLVSMPHSVWNIVQHDKVCCFLGHITSHNMTHLYKRLVGSIVTAPAASAKDVEDGKILLEAREALVRHEQGAQPQGTPAQSAPHPPNGNHAVPEATSTTPVRPRTGVRHGLPSSAPSSATKTAAPVVAKGEVEDSAEMQEAAEQLKALSHLGHGAGEPQTGQKRPHAGDGSGRSSHDAAESGADEALSVMGSGTTTPPSKHKHRRSLLQKQPAPKQETRCTMCTHAPFKDSSSLRKHIAAAHTRPFPCAFSFAGCTSTFGSKNEWKRHISSQHLCLQYYRCSSCPLSAIEGKGNEFNRKDLFTQHLRRMHAPFAIKKAIKSDGKLQVEWENHVKDMQQSCLVTRRKPPQRSACPKPGCQTVFEGPTSWDEWTEHVGRHMEKGEGQRIGVDRLLAKWALEEGIIERKDDGEYRLCNQDELPGRKDASINAFARPETPKDQHEKREQSPQPEQEQPQRQRPQEEKERQNPLPQQQQQTQQQQQQQKRGAEDDGSIVVATTVSAEDDRMDVDD
ncbi:hypothetical protein MAPG_05681 [Magnaporthiopsis poae ATCC 64411]|uniref:C2H2-type domain-containing protein n=1 Tax=Magnaporthiopsis poae (strain ATCC 64411 / 73-15) TaxID=644358 RepID=A0A0C4E015_MAGP6|nr:hypothetical protein MAPG_05681 [Magnaporthiopsis poae ATCC 64411]